MKRSIVLSVVAALAAGCGGAADCPAGTERAGDGCVEIADSAMRDGAVELRDAEADASTPCDPSAADPIDVRDVDENCDGVDGVATELVFVAPPPRGDDANTGTRSSPVATISRALEIAGTRSIVVAVGSYDATGLGETALSVTTASGIHGGYDPVSWRRGAAASILEVPFSGAMLELRAELVLERLEIRAADATSPGGSSIALRVGGGAGGALVLRSSVVQAGRGAAGSDGESGDVVAGEMPPMPRAGTPGQSCAGISTATGSCTSSAALGPSVFAGTSCPGAPPSARGGDGGGSGSAGSPGGGGAGAGGTGMLGANIDGEPGEDGDAGSPGAAGAAGAGLGTFGAEGQYEPADGMAGEPGTSGEGGGGGGGGAAATQGVCTAGAPTWTYAVSPRGASGGSGGEGGCGGLPGTGGRGGGASIAVLVSEGVAVRLEGATLRTGAGGAGGRGGAGGLGRGGGAGGAGGVGPCVSSSSWSGADGGKGGNGGPGGSGGSGGGGGGGPSLGVVLLGGASVERDAASRIELGAGGLGGASDGQRGSDGARAETREVSGG